MNILHLLRVMRLWKFGEIEPVDTPMEAEAMLREFGMEGRMRRRRGRVNPDDEDEDWSYISMWEGLSDSPEADPTIRPDLPCGVVYPIFAPKKGEPFEFSTFKLCGTKIDFVRPVHALSEDGQDSFTVHEVELGRLTELQAMDRVQFGAILSERGAKRLAQERNTTIIGCRWVLAKKETPEGSICRAPCNAQQIAAGGGSAVSLGISSSTPSLEALRLVLSAIYEFDLCAETLDISTAFLHSPLPANVTAIVRLPGDLSMSPDYQESDCDQHPEHGWSCARE